MFGNYFKAGSADTSSDEEESLSEEELHQMPQSTEVDANDSLYKSYSANSKLAFIQLDRLEKLLTDYEDKFFELCRLTEQDSSDAVLTKVKNELSLLSGNVDKLQMSGIDSVTVSELSTGKEEARIERKELSRRVQELSDKVHQWHAHLVDWLKG